MIKAPCKDCERRSADCHAHCPEYKAFEAAKREEYAKRAAQHDAEAYSANKERQLRRSMLKKAKRPGY